MVLVFVIVITISRCYLIVQVLNLAICSYSLIYFAEKDSLKKWTFLESFWWGLMALTTVGNGEKVPSSWIGKVRLL